MTMVDRKIMDSFKKEWEIPDPVAEKMQEAYRRIGAKESGATVAGRGRSRRSGRRYLKAASLVAAVLIIGATAGAAAGINEPLKKLFQKDSGLAKESSSVPDTKTVQNTMSGLNVEIDSISGTDEMAYIIFRVQRKDGGNFDKNKVYNFRNVNIWDVTSESVNMNEREYSYSASGCSFMIENEGTSELRIVYQTTYERTVGGKTEYLRGRQCKILLEDLVEETDEGRNPVEMYGDLELSFKMEYGDALTKTKDTNVAISFPLCDSDEYIPMGRLREVTVTPYYVRYGLEWKERDDEGKDYFEQIYVEMDDGSFMGYRTEEDMNEYGMRMVSTGGGSYDRETGLGEHEGIVFLPELIDVKHVRAVYFGKTRIEVN